MAEIRGQDECVTCLAPSAHAGFTKAEQDPESTEVVLSLKSLMECLAFESPSRPARMFAASADVQAFIGEQHEHFALHK